MLLKVFLFSFFSLGLAQLFRTIYTVAVFELTHRTFESIGPLMFIQGLIGWITGAIILTRLKIPLWPITNRRKVWLKMGLPNVLTGILPVLAYVLGVSFNFVQLVALPAYGFMQAYHLLAREHGPSRRSYGYAMILLFMSVAFLGIQGEPFKLLWVPGALVLAYVMWWRDLRARRLKKSYGTAYVRAVAEELAYSGPVIALSGLVISLFTKREETLRMYRELSGVWPVVLLSTIVIALILERYVATKNGGFRELMTCSQWRLLFLAGHQVVSGARALNDSLIAGFFFAIWGLIIQWRGFERRRIKALAGLL